MVIEALESLGKEQFKHPDKRHLFCWYEEETNGYDGGVTPTAKGEEPQARQRAD